MQKIADSSAGAHGQAKETAEYAKQVGETVIEKDREITKLRKGYQLSMIGPLIKGILELRDKLTALEGLSDIDEATKKELNELNQSAVSALKDVGVNEIDIKHGTDPTEFALHKWDALEVSRQTTEENLSKKVAEVVTSGYVALGPDASDVVVRKAKVIRYKYSESEGEDN
jgi:molecular chaperone GrpE (heat shock protein)